MSAKLKTPSILSPAACGDGRLSSRGRVARTIKTRGFWHADVGPLFLAQFSRIVKSLAHFALSAFALSCATFQNVHNSTARAAEPAADAAVAAPLTPEQIAEGWISLFDGHSLFGWHSTSEANWYVEDGAIAVSEGEQGFLMTGVNFADYELHVEFKAPATTNSGIFLRTPLEPTDPAKDCYELNIAPADNPFPTGSLVGRKKWPDPEWTAYPAVDPNQNPAAAPEGIAEGWIPFDVVVSGDKVKVKLLGQSQYEYEYADPTGLTRGRIGLQFREGPVAFRNIRLRPLGLQPMLNGKDLAGWNTKNAEASKFEMTVPSDSLPLEGTGAPSTGDSKSPERRGYPSRSDGEGGDAGTSSTLPSLTLPSRGRGQESPNSGGAELHVTNGRGILETDASYGDFVMQLDAFVDGDALNSGVFFRSIPGEYANGYESQIHNGIKNHDPAQPTDFGTGAIYRRTPARRVVSKDHEWFTKTIVATGPQIAVWVNGYQVTDWTDERPPSDNPREGLRLAPGTISLQGHDPTTKLRFRNLRIVELPSTQP
jgi:hypothetical protein